MSDHKPATISRRDAIKIITAAGAGTLLFLPVKWSKPMMNIGAMPAHAQTSIIRSLVCPQPTEPVVLIGNFTTTATVQVVPPAAGIAVNYSVTTADGLIDAPIPNSGSTLTDGSGIASINVDINPINNGGVTVVWTLPGGGSCTATYSWFLQDF